MRGNWRLNPYEVVENLLDKLDEDSPECLEYIKYLKDIYDSEVFKNGLLDEGLAKPQGPIYGWHIIAFSITVCNHTIRTTGVVCLDEGLIDWSVKYEAK